MIDYTTVNQLTTDQAAALTTLLTAMQEDATAMANKQIADEAAERSRLSVTDARKKYQVACAALMEAMGVK
jgi:hypothetical protein